MATVLCEALRRELVYVTSMRVYGREKSEGRDQLVVFQEFDMSRGRVDFSRYHCQCQWWHSPCPLAAHHGASVETRVESTIVKSADVLMQLDGKLAALRVATKYTRQLEAMILMLLKQKKPNSQTGTCPAPRPVLRVSRLMRYSHIDSRHLPWAKFGEHREFR